MGGGYPQDGEGLWDVVIKPGCELRSRLLVADAPLEGPGVKRPPVLIAVVTGLRDPQVDPA